MIKSTEFISMCLVAGVSAILIEKGEAVVLVEDEPPKLDFDNIIPEHAPWKIEDWDVPSGKKKAQWKSEINGRKLK